MATATKYNMGPTRSYRVPAPSKLELIEHRGRMITAKPAGVPPKWLSLYHDLAALMYSDGPSFSIGKDTKDSPVMCTAMTADGWAAWSTPQAARAALGMATEPTKAIAPKAKAEPKTHRAFGIAAPAPIIEEIRAPTSSLPTWAEEWLGKLEYETKRDYARQYLEHILCDAPAPADPGAEWADKARKRADRLAKLAA